MTSRPCVPRLKKPQCQALPCLTVFGKPVPEYEGCGKWKCDPFDFLVQQQALQVLDASGNSVNTPQRSAAVADIARGPISACETGGQYMPLVVPGQLTSGIAGSNTFIQTSNTRLCVNPPSTFYFCPWGTTLGIETRTPGTCGRFGPAPILNGPGSIYM
jgi:hypothetical protein